MVGRNKKSMIKLIRLPILRLLLLKREILSRFKSLKISKDLYGWMPKLATKPYKSFKLFEFSNYHKILPPSIFMIDMVTIWSCDLSCKEPTDRTKYRNLSCCEFALELHAVSYKLVLGTLHVHVYYKTMTALPTKTPLKKSIHIFKTTLQLYRLVQLV